MKQILVHFPEWEIKYFEDQKSKISRADLIRLGTYFLILEYKGKYDKKTLDEVAFRARKKVEK